MCPASCRTRQISLSRFCHVAPPIPIDGVFLLPSRKMKQTFAKAALLVSACLLGAMSLPANAEALEKYRVAITDLVLSPSLSASAAKTVSQSSLRSDMEAGVRNSRKFDVVSRNAATLNLDFSSPGYSKGVQSQHGPLG